MIFVDTGVFYAQLAEDDANHLAALAFFRDVTEPLVTTKDVVFETHAVMQRISRERPTADMRPAALRFLDSIDGGLARVLDVTDADHVSARAIVERHRDKTYSLCDALSFAVMERLKITRAASFDSHFRQYGKFIVLP
jgi:predicted nucleic acid-binding protein